MAIAEADIEVGGLYEFPKGQRRVARIEGKEVFWTYPDGRTPRGQTKGRMWLPYFARKAVRRLPDEDTADAQREYVASEIRKLMSAGIDAALIAEVAAEITQDEVPSP